MDSIKEDRQPGWWWVEHGVIDYLPVVGLTAWGLYTVLATHMAHHDSACFPSYRRLAAMMGVNKRTVMRAMDTLVEHGLVRREERVVARRKAESKGLRTSNNYYLARIGGDTLPHKTNNETVVTPRSPRNVVNGDTTITTVVTPGSPPRNKIQVNKIPVPSGHATASPSPRSRKSRTLQQDNPPCIKEPAPVVEPPKAALAEKKAAAPRKARATAKQVVPGAKNPGVDYMTPQAKCIAADHIVSHWKWARSLDWTARGGPITDAGDEQSVREALERIVEEGGDYFDAEVELLRYAETLARDKQGLAMIHKKLTNLREWCSTPPSTNGKHPPEPAKPITATIFISAPLAALRVGTVEDALARGDRKIAVTEEEAARLKEKGRNK